MQWEYSHAAARAKIVPPSISRGTSSAVSGLRLVRDVVELAKLSRFDF